MSTSLNLCYSNSHFLGVTSLSELLVPCNWLGGGGNGSLFCILFWSSAWMLAKIELVLLDGNFFLAASLFLCFSFFASNASNASLSSVSKATILIASKSSGSTAPHAGVKSAEVAIRRFSKLWPVKNLRAFQIIGSSSSWAWSIQGSSVCCWSSPSSHNIPA